MPAKYLLNRFFPLQIPIRTLLGDARSVFLLTLKFLCLLVCLVRSNSCHNTICWSVDHYIQVWLLCSNIHALL